MCIEYPIEDMGHIRYYVAPKIDSDEVDVKEEIKEEVKEEVKDEMDE